MCKYRSTQASCAGRKSFLLQYHHDGIKRIIRWEIATKFHPAEIAGKIECSFTKLVTSAMSLYTSFSEQPETSRAAKTYRIIFFIIIRTSSCRAQLLNLYFFCFLLFYDYRELEVTKTIGEKYILYSFDIALSASSRRCLRFPSSSMSWNFTTTRH